MGDNLCFPFRPTFEGGVSDSIEAAGRTVPWTPEAGKYSLALADGDGKILDYVYFEVRGQEASRKLLSEDEEGTFTN